jgi:hypothetical protein
MSDYTKLCVGGPMDGQTARQRPSGYGVTKLHSVDAYGRKVTFSVYAVDEPGTGASALARLIGGYVPSDEE